MHESESGFELYNILKILISSVNCHKLDSMLKNKAPGVVSVSNDKNIHIKY